MKNKKLTKIIARAALTVFILTLMAGFMPLYMPSAEASGQLFELDKIAEDIGNNIFSGTDWEWNYSFNNAITITATGDITLSGDSGGRKVHVLEANQVTLAEGTKIIVNSSSPHPGTALWVNHNGGANLHTVIIGDGPGVTIRGYYDGGGLDPYAYGIRNAALGGSITLKGTFGSISAFNGVNSGSVTAIYADGDVTIAEGAWVGSITASGSGGGNTGIFSGGHVTISGRVDTIEVSGGLGSNSRGIYVTQTDGKVVIDGSVGTIESLDGGGVGILLGLVAGGLDISGSVGEIDGRLAGIIMNKNAGFTISNNAVVYTSGVFENVSTGTIPVPGDPITPDPTESQGILFVAGDGVVYGDVSLKDDLIIYSEQTLTVPENSSLTVPQGKTLSNNNKITNDGVIRNNGFIRNFGLIENEGSIRNNSIIINNDKIMNSGNGVINPGGIINGRYNGNRHKNNDEPGVWQPGMGDVEWDIEADYDRFWRIMPGWLDSEGEGNDDAPLPSGSYSVRPGSTIITLHESYLRTLPPGTYEFFRAEFLNGNAEMSLTIVGVPQTGDSSGFGGFGIAPALVMLGFSILGAAGTLILRKQFLNRS